MFPSDRNIRRVFEEGFCARDIAQALPSFDAACRAETAATAMQSRGLAVVGVRTAGLITGYIEAAALSGICCGDCQWPIQPDQLVSDALPLASLVERLAQHPFCFVMTWEEPSGWVSRQDLQKPPARMWLFGMVTLIETRFGQLIADYYPRDEWKVHLSPGRIQKAETLKAERLRIAQHITLADCLQFADKAQIVARSETLRALTRFSSKKQIEEIGRKLEKLRNNLAHSQDIVQGDWETIVLLAKHVGSILDGPVVKDVAHER